MQNPANTKKPDEEAVRLRKRENERAYRERRKADPDRHAASIKYQRAYRAANKVKTREVQYAARRRNPEKYNEIRRRWRLKNTEKIRDNYILVQYGMTRQDWDAMFAAQGSKCAGCGRTGPESKTGWHTDHCHSSGKVRGILCHKCNVALGNVQDNTATLLSLVDYIEKHK